MEYSGEPLALETKLAKAEFDRSVQSIWDSQIPDKVKETPGFHYGVFYSYVRRTCRLFIAKNDRRFPSV